MPGPRLNDRLRALRTLRQQEEHALAGHELKSAINVTPLVDVVLVLLIIFMVVTPLIASGVAVDLPRTAHHSRKPDDGKDIIISVTAKKRIYVGSKLIARPEDVGRAVSAEKRRSPEKDIFLKGDARASFGVVREVMDELHRGDIDDVVLGTEELVKRN
jgi:biopolymer transport protein TolR